MTARKGARKAAAGAPHPAAAAGPDTPTSDDTPSPEKTVELSKATTGAEPDPVAAVEFTPAPVKPSPVKRYAAPRPKPFRAGGHVLTERGWVLDTIPEQES